MTSAIVEMKLDEYKRREDELLALRARVAKLEAALTAAQQLIRDLGSPQAADRLGSEFGLIKMSEAMTEATIDWVETKRIDDILAEHFGGLERFEFRQDAIQELIDQARQVESLRARVAKLDEELRFLIEETKWKSVDRDNMEFEGRITCYQLDQARAALKDAPQ